MKVVMEGFKELTRDLISDGGQSALTCEKLSFTLNIQTLWCSVLVFWLLIFLLVGCLHGFNLQILIHYFMFMIVVVIITLEWPFHRHWVNVIHYMERWFISLSHMQMTLGLLFEGNFLFVCVCWCGLLNVHVQNN